MTAVRAINEFKCKLSQNSRSKRYRQISSLQGYCDNQHNRNISSHFEKMWSYWTSCCNCDYNKYLVLFKIVTGFLSVSCVSCDSAHLVSRKRTMTMIVIFSAVLPLRYYCSNTIGWTDAKDKHFIKPVQHLDCTIQWLIWPTSSCIR